jgi:hypothetical protein
MIERRITGWKQECRVIADLLKPILTQTKLKTNLDEHIHRLPSTDNITQRIIPPDEEEALVNSRVDLVSAPLSVNGDIDLAMDQKSLEQISPRSSQETSDPMTEDSNKELSVIPSLVTMTEYLPSVLEMSPYDGIVSKLHHQQKIIVRNDINPTGPSDTVTLLGPKTFTDEGRIQTIHRRVMEDEEAQERETQEHPVAYDPSTSEYFFTMDHYVTRDERKKMLLSYIKERKGINMM